MTQAVGRRRGPVFPLRITPEERAALEALMAAGKGPRALGPFLLWRALGPEARSAGAGIITRTQVIPARAGDRAGNTGPGRAKAAAEPYLDEAPPAEPYRPRPFDDLTLREQSLVLEQRRRREQGPPLRTPASEQGPPFAVGDRVRALRRIVDPETCFEIAPSRVGVVTRSGEPLRVRWLSPDSGLPLVTLAPTDALERIP
jgi:hypothetical protein